MSFSSTITITGSTNITNFDIYQCPTSGCTGCVAITGSTGENVSRTKLLTGHTVSIDQGFRYVKLVADTTTCNNSICMEVIGIPTYTPTPTPSFTPTPTATNVPSSTNTPTPTATNVPPGSTNTPTPTATNVPTNTPTPTPTATAGPTNTPTPTSIPLPGCGDTINGTYAPSGSTIQTYSLDLSEATNGATISVHYTANSRPDKFNIYEDGFYLTGSTWAGSDTDYMGPWTGNPIDGDGDGYFTFVYNSSKPYQLKVDVGNANPTNILEDSWSVTFSCLGVATSTPTPSPTPNYYNITVNLQGMVGSNGNLTIYQSSDGIFFESSLTLTSNDGDYASSGFNGTPGYYYYMIVARTSGTMADLNLYTQVGLSDFSPGPINNAWCANNSNTLQSDTFQLPNPTQTRQSIVFYGGINEGCL